MEIGDFLFTKGDVDKAEVLYRALKENFPKAMNLDAEHPVVRTHPETGEKVLFVNAFTTHISNYHTPERVRFGQDASPGASQLLNYLISQAAIPEYQVRWRWKKNSVAFWDNRVTQHYAVNDYLPHQRIMNRATVLGDRPYHRSRMPKDMARAAE